MERPACLSSILHAIPPLIAFATTPHRIHTPAAPSYHFYRIIGLLARAPASKSSARGGGENRKRNGASGTALSSSTRRARLAVVSGEAWASNKRVYRDIGREIKLKSRVLLPMAPPPKWPLNIAYSLLHLLGATPSTSGGVRTQEDTVHHILRQSKVRRWNLPWIVNSVTTPGRSPKFIAD